jgi:hypothetical protein
MNEAENADVFTARLFLLLASQDRYIRLEVAECTIFVMRNL